MGEDRQDASTTAAAQQPGALWCQGIAAGSFVQEVQQSFPRVTWQPAELVKVLSYALPAAVAAVGINSQLPGLLTGLSSSSIQGAPATAVQGEAAADSIQQLALLHLSQEAVLALLLPTACRLALGPRVTAAEGSSYWAVQTLGTCLLLFPLVDLGLSSLWQPAAEVLFGPAPANPLVETLQQAGSSGQFTAVAEHCLASGLLGPFWEEVFWRGFFLTALTKVLPIPACIGLSALNFAALHLSPVNFLPLLVLGATCDCLYLRSGGNLLAPLLLHGLWNTSQVLQIALLHKDTFV